MSRSTWAVASLLAIAVPLSQGCRDDTAPAGPSFAADSRAALSESSERPRHLVVFANERTPADFADRVAALGGSVERVIGGVGLAVVTGLADDVANSLATSPDVRAVERDLRLDPVGLVEPAAELPPVVDEQVVIANDGSPTSAAFYARQWHLRAVSADAAWARGHLGSPAVSVAILDSGIDYLHPDLEGRVDLSRSISLVPALDAQVAALFPGRHPITDLNFHGTATTGLIVSNAIHLAAITQRTTVFGVKVHDGVLGSPISVYFAGIVHAVEQGADVIHMSFGGLFSRREHPGLVAAVNRVVNFAERRGVVLVTYSGNTAAPVNVVGGPGDYDHDRDRFGFCVAPHVICVSATGPTSAASLDGPWTDVDAISPFSNFGRSAIDVAAPGGAPLRQVGPGGGVWVLCPLTTQVDEVFPFIQCRLGAGLLISPGAGTSWSAAKTSGLAALLVAALGKGNPARIRARILESADDLGEPGADPYYGRGRINVGRALGTLP